MISWDEQWVSRQRATPPTDSRCSSVEPSFAVAHEDDGTLRSALSRASRRSIVPAVAGAIPACRREVDGNRIRGWSVEIRRRREWRSDLNQRWAGDRGYVG